MKDGKGMAAPIAVGGHYDATSAPKMKKGEFAAVGTFIDEGDMTTVEPRGTSVNVKTGKTQVGNSEFSMPPMDRPPMSPQAQAQMGPPGGAGFGPAIGQAQEQMGKNQTDLAVSTVEKILMGVTDDTFQTYAKRAIAILKTGAAMAQQKGPQSQPGGMPPPGAGAPPPQLPPMPGQMPG